MLNGKGAYTEIVKVDGVTKIVQRKVMYEDGCRAFLCALGSFGETEKRKQVPTAYAFTYDRDKGLIYLSEGYRDEERKKTVHDAAMGAVCLVNVGCMIASGIKLKWLSDEEMAQAKSAYEAEVKSACNAPGAQIDEIAAAQQIGGDTGNDADMGVKTEKRLRCKVDNRLLPKGKKSCPKCGGKEFVEVDEPIQ
jgi:hypothetical protein